MVPTCYRAQLGFGAQRMTTAAAAEEKMADFVFKSVVVATTIFMKFSLIQRFFFGCKNLPKGATKFKQGKTKIYVRSPAKYF
jgi:hypothetical protein